MNIVITDGFTLNPGDLDWKPFQTLGNLVYYDRTPPELINERCKEAEIIITNKTPVTADTIRLANKLKLIAVTATGYNVVDTVAAKEKGIVVCNVPVYGTDSVAQHVMGLILELSNHIGKNAETVAHGEWSRNADWCYTTKPIMELHGKTLGIIGFGRIGQRVAEIARAFGMNIIFNNKEKQSSFARRVSLEELFAHSDIISLHCPLNKDNEGFVDGQLLSLMKPSAFLINTARGQLINEQDLAIALKQGKPAAAALDVLSKEPPPADHPLIGLENCLITPHNAWISYEARKRLMQTTLENIQAFLEGKPQNQVN